MSMDTRSAQPPDRENRDNVVKNTISQDETEQDDTLDHPRFVDGKRDVLHAPSCDHDDNCI